MYPVGAGETKCMMKTSDDYMVKMQNRRGRGGA
jgi:hypothetical protein